MRPSRTARPIWGDFDAHEIFDELPGRARHPACKIGFAAFYESMGRVDLTERHGDEKPFSISGTKVREQLKGGQRPDRAHHASRRSPTFSSRPIKE